MKVQNPKFKILNNIKIQMKKTIKKFRVAQKLFLFNDRDEVLILRFSEQNIPETAGLWDFPGGKVEFAESLGDGLRREMKEEVGEVEYEVGELELVWDWYLDRDPSIRVVCVGYGAKYLGGEIELNQEHDEFRWIQVNDLGECNWFEADRRAVNYLKEKYGKK